MLQTSELIQRIQSLYSRGVQSDDTRLSSRHIYSKLLTSRARLIKQQLNKKQKISQWNYQTLHCVELEKAELHECPCLPPLGCSIMKTKYPIPQPISSMDKEMLQSVTSLDGSVIYSKIGWVEKKYKSANKYTASKPDYYIRNDFLYVTHKNGPKVITITGLFENPFEADKYPSLCDKDCKDCNCNSPLDNEFPIDSSMVDTLIELTVQELIVLFSKGIEDLTNDTKDSPIEQSK